MLPFFLQPKLGLEKTLWVHTTKLAPNISCASDEIREQQLGKRDHSTEQWIMHKDPISNSGMLVLPGTFKAFPNLFHCRQQSCGGVTVMPFHHLSIDRRKYDRRHTSSKWLLDFSCCSLVSELSLFFFLFPCFFFWTGHVSSSSTPEHARTISQVFQPMAAQCIQKNGTLSAWVSSDFIYIMGWQQQCSYKSSQSSAEDFTETPSRTWKPQLCCCCCCSGVQAATPSPPPEPEAFLRSSYISSIIGFHNLTRALMNQLETWQCQIQSDGRCVHAGSQKLLYLAPAQAAPRR
jgi:hypothetical protein